MTITADVAIVGGGISGISLAARLAPHARVVVIEAEEQLGTQASGRSAALLVEAYGPPPVRRLTSISRGFFESPPEGFSETPLARRRGALIYGSGAQRDRVRAEYEEALRTAPVVWVEGATLETLCPLLKPGVGAVGYLEPGVLDLDTHALLTGFLRQARAGGVAVLTAAPLTAATVAGGAWDLRTGAGPVSCGLLVDAAGAWADEVAELAGIERWGLTPMRRTAATLRVPEDLAGRLAQHPFVGPVDSSYYFKPETGAVMVSLSEESPSEPCDAHADDLDVSLALERFHAATIMPRARPVAVWAGLRTFAADRLPVVGREPGTEGFFWYAGQGGTGLQTSPGQSALAAKLILGEALEPGEAEIAAACSSRRRPA